jgi:hypothetical protein
MLAFIQTIVPDPDQLQEAFEAGLQCMCKINA